LLPAFQHRLNVGSSAIIGLHHQGVPIAESNDLNASPAVIVQVGALFVSFERDVAFVIRRVEKDVFRILIDQLIIRQLETIGKKGGKIRALPDFGRLNSIPS
jgi:ABC-type transporter Mla maintaining outer membrane lipid asymmetry ATPase subunit MlaF